MTLKDKVAVITGAGRGIGKAALAALRTRRRQPRLVRAHVQASSRRR